MEPRVLLSAVFWTGTAGDNNWDTPANWNTHSLPGPNDNVTINTSADVVHSSAAMDSILSLTSTEPLTISGGTRAIAGAATTSANLTISGGTLTGTGDITVGGLLTLTSGVLTDLRAVSANGGILINPSNEVFYLNDCTLTNAAGQTAPWFGSSSDVFATNAVFNNIGTFLAESDGTFTVGSGNVSTFNNQGTFTRSTDVGEVDIGPEVAFNDFAGGKVNVQTGTLGIIDGGTGVDAAFAIAPNATLKFGGLRGDNSYTFDKEDLRGQTYFLVISGDRKRRTGN